MPACATPWLAKEAIDAFKQPDRRWGDTVKESVVRGKASNCLRGAYEQSAAWM